MITSSSLEIVTTELRTFMTGGISSDLSCEQDMNDNTTNHAIIIAKSIFFQPINICSLFLCAFKFALNMFQGMRSKVASEVSFRYCAYPWTAAVPTCLHIPMQLNKAYFTSTVPAPTLQTIPFLAFRAVNADKRYPRPCPLMHARKTGIPS